MPRRLLWSEGCPWLAMAWGQNWGSWSDVSLLPPIALGSYTFLASRPSLVRPPELPPPPFSGGDSSLTRHTSSQQIAVILLLQKILWLSLTFPQLFQTVNSKQSGKRILQYTTLNLGVGYYVRLALHHWVLCVDPWTALLGGKLVDLLWFFHVMIRLKVLDAFKYNKVTRYLLSYPVPKTTS